MPNAAALPAPNPGPVRTALTLGAWFGFIAGLGEGAGLLLFQRVNWARWGAETHISAEILWISAVVNLLLFSVVALLIALAGRVLRRIPVVVSTVFALTFLTIFDWLALTQRLSRTSCFLLALGVAVACGRSFTRHSASLLFFWKRSLPAAFALVMLLMGGIFAARRLREDASVRNSPAAQPGVPNVLVIVVDTLRADHLSSYGYARPTSPNIDRIAQQGVLFENAVSTTSWSLPSHVSLLSGRYLFEHGVGNISPLPVVSSSPQALGGGATLGEVLQQRGYRTGAFSANRVFFTANLGFSRGFQHFEDYFHSPADMFLRTFYGKELVGKYLVRTEHSLPKRLLRRLGLDSLLDSESSYTIRKRAPIVNREILHWIDRDPGRPFFAFLNYFDVHAPYGAPRSYPVPPWPQQTAIDQYDDSIRYTDAALGRLFDSLLRRGLDQNTILVITSDHGESLGEHHIQTHSDALYRELIHVPLIFWSPGRIPSGLRIARPVTNAAIPATVINLIGNGGSNPFPRASLVPLWKDPSAGSDSSDVLSEISKDIYGIELDKNVARYVPTSLAGPMKSLVTSRWHLILHKQLGYQLYDWLHDPQETRNLIDVPENRQIARALMSRLQNVVAGSAGEQQKEKIAGAPNLAETSFDVPGRSAGVPVNDYFKFTAQPGSRINLSLQVPASEPANRFDPVLSIENEDGVPLETCRDPGDDHRPSPGTPDPTPNAFDDVCINDDQKPNATLNSSLTLQVPGNASSPATFYVRSSDWNGQVGPGLGYRVVIDRITDAAPAPKPDH